MSVQILWCSYIDDEPENWLSEEKALSEVLKWLASLMVDMSNPPYIESGRANLYASFQTEGYKNWRMIIIGAESRCVTTIMRSYKESRFKRSATRKYKWGTDGCSRLVNAAILKAFKFDVTESNLASSSSVLVSRLLC